MDVGVIERIVVFGSGRHSARLTCRRKSENRKIRIIGRVFRRIGRVVIAQGGPGDRRLQQAGEGAKERCLKFEVGSGQAPMSPSCNHRSVWLVPLAA